MEFGLFSIIPFFFFFKQMHRWTTDAVSQLLIQLECENRGTLEASSRNVCVGVCVFSGQQRGSIPELQLGIHQGLLLRKGPLSLVTPSSSARGQVQLKHSSDPQYMIQI